MKMRILSIDYASINSYGGVSTFNRNLFKFFEGDIQFGTFYKNNSALQEKEFNLGVPKNISFKGLNYVSGYRLYAYYFKRLVERLNPDIVIVNSPSLVRYLDNKQIIILVQHISFDVMMKNKANFGGECYFKFVMGKINKFILLSPQDKAEISEEIEPKHKNKLHYIRHAYPSDKIEFRTKEFSKSLVIVARLDIAHKRLDLAIKAMFSLPDWTLTIYGEGKDRKKLESIILSLDLKNVCLFGGVINAPSYMVNHDVHIMTSDIEGYGITNIEAMVSGLPLIVRNTYPAASDIIDGNGVLLGKDWDEHEYIKALQTIESNYDAMSRRSLYLTGKYSKSTISTQWQEMINKVSIL